MVQKILENTDLRINYDEDADVLYASFGEPKMAVSKEVEDGKFVRFDPFTDEIVGVTILDFKQCCMLPNQNIAESTERIIRHLIEAV